VVLCNQSIVAASRKGFLERPDLRPDGYRLIENRRDYLSFNFSKRVISASSACITFSELRWSLLKEGLG
jgi:hypothetical protein